MTTSRPSRRTLVTIAILGVAGVVVWMAVAYANFYQIENPDHSSHLPAALEALTWILVGELAWARRPANPLGRWMIAVGFLSYVYVIGLVATPLTRTLGDRLGQLSVVVIALVFLAFPNGRLRDRTDRVLMVVVTAFWAVASVLQGMVDQHPLNMLRVTDDQALVDLIFGLTHQLSAVLILVVAGHVVVHWWREGPAGRRVMTPVLWALIPYVAVVALDYIGQVVPNTLSAWAGDWMGAVIEGFALPICFLLGILRTNLARSSLPSLVQELDDGVQPGGLVAVLRRGLGDPSLRIAYPLPDGGWVDANGASVAEPRTEADRAVTPIGRPGAPVAILVHDPALSADPELVAAAGAAARMALENERLQAEVLAQLEEVRASRGRIVEAGLEARRKVERDLHDGAQQRLLALSVRLQLARHEAAGSPHLEATLDGLGRDLGTAIGELRELARGIHPAALTQGGLSAATQDLADGASIPVEVSVTSRSLLLTCESAAYFVIAEALANVTRHAAAGHAAVRVDSRRTTWWSRSPTTASAVPTWHVAAASAVSPTGSRPSVGRLELDSPPGAGTRLTARIPCASS